MRKVVLADDYHYSVCEVGQGTCEDQYFEGEGDDGGPFVDDEGGSEMPQKAEVVDHQQQQVENIDRLDVVVVASEVPAEIDQVQSYVANTGSYHADLVRIDQQVQLCQLSETQGSLSAAQQEDDDRYEVVCDSDVVELEVFATYRGEVVLPRQVVALCEKGQQIDQRQQSGCKYEARIEGQTVLLSFYFLFSFLQLISGY